MFLKLIYIKIINFTGPGADRMTYLGTAVLVGMLTGRTKNGLNLVNAPTLAKESGMTVTLDRTNSVKREEGDSNNTTIIGVILHQKDGGETYSITGKKNLAQNILVSVYCNLHNS